MDEKRIPLEKEVPTHRKKSKKKGRPRADHKHEYKIVLLHHYFDNPFKQGDRKLFRQVTEVCSICGRRGSNCVTGLFAELTDEYDITNLEKWYVDDYFDKFAKKMEE